MLFFWEAGVVHEEIWVRRNSKELAAVVFNGWGLTVETTGTGLGDEGTE